MIFCEIDGVRYELELEDDCIVNTTGRSIPAGTAIYITTDSSELSMIPWREDGSIQMAPVVGTID